MKIIYFICILGFISCLTLPKVFDIWYNYEFDLKSQIDPAYTGYIFRFPVNSDTKMDIEIKIGKNDTNSFIFQIFEYSYYPTDDEIISKTGQEKTIIGSTQYEEEGYLVYSFTFSSSIGGKYFGIYVDLPYDVQYSYLVFRANVSRYKYSKIKDLNFGSDYIIDTSAFEDKIIPNSYQMYVRIPVIPQEEIELELTTHKNYDENAFTVDICGYSYKPTEAQVYYGDPGATCTYSLENISDEDKKYKYNLTVDDNSNYLSIRIINNLNDLSYLHIYINDDQHENPSEDPSEDPSDGNNGDIIKSSSILFYLIILTLL